LVDLTAYDLCYQVSLDSDPLKDVVDYALAHDRVLMVTGNRPALDLAVQVDDVKPAVVKVLDLTSGTSRYLFPEWVISQVALNKGAAAETLVEAVGMLVADTRYPNRTHLHEWLNLTRPNQAWCPGAPGRDGPHPTVGTVPCWKHRSK